MKRIFTYQTQRTLGEVMRNLSTGWVVSQAVILNLLHDILRDLRHGVEEEELTRVGAVKVEEVIPATRHLSDTDTVKYHRYIEACKQSPRLFEREVGVALAELLDKYTDITE